MKKNNFRKYFFRAVAVMLACMVLGGCNSEKDDNIIVSANSGTAVKRENKSNKTNSSGKRVAVTYDDGPHNVYTKKIVDELSKYGYHATFFTVGNRIASINDQSREYNGAEAAKYAFDKGNELAIHGYTHNYYYNRCEHDIYVSEMADTKEAILTVAPKAKVKLMRPIGGNITDERVEECPYSVIMWSVDSEDWKHKGRGDDDAAKQNIDRIVENVMSQVSDGDIILMHDIYENTYEATKIILKKLHDQGYDVVTVSELLDNPKAGVKCSSAKIRKASDE